MGRTADQSCAFDSVTSVSSVVQHLHGWTQNERNHWVARNRRHTSMRPTILGKLIALDDARSNLARDDGIARLWSAVRGNGFSITATKTTTNHAMDTEGRIRRLQVDAQLTGPGDVGRSSGQELLRRLMRGRRFSWSVSLSDMIYFFDRPGSR